MNRILSGLLAGAAATAPMSAVMELLHHWPRPEREPLPPTLITLRVAREAGLSKPLRAAEARAAAIVASHFAYGAGCGVLFALLKSRASNSNSSAKRDATEGAAFGLAVWSASYLGWLPVLGVLRSATTHTARRNTLMIVAHLVWGAATALLLRRWAREEESGA